MTVGENAKRLEALAQKYLQLIRNEADDKRAKTLLLALIIDAKMLEGD